MNLQGQRGGERISRALSGACIGAALAFAPLVFGASEPWAFSILAVLAYTALAAATVRAILEREFRPFAVPLLLPLALALCLVVLQHAHWPAKLLSLASPRTVAAYADGSATVGVRLPSSIPGSLYAHGTFLALVRLSSYVALFAATCGYVRGLREIAILGIVILSVAFAAALIGIFQSLSGTDKVYWLRRAPHGGFFGPFAGRNQYATYAAICTFMGIGLLLVRAGRWIGAELTWAEWLSKNGPEAVLLVFAIGVIGASVPWSLSRAGTLSMLLGFGGVLGAAGLTRRRKRYWGLIGACLVAVLAVITCLGWGRVIERLSTLEDIARDPSATWRWQMFGDAVRMGRDFPALGVGAGAFPSVYPVYRTIPTSSLVESPHNEYLHVFAEAGVPGALLLLCGLLIAFGIVLKGLCGRRHSYLPGLIAGGFGAMFAVSVHSLADYPMRSPAVAATAAVLVAMLCRASAMKPSRNQGPFVPATTERGPASVPPGAGRALEWNLVRPDTPPTAPMPARRPARAGAFLGIAAVAVLWGAAVQWGSSPLRAEVEKVRLDASSKAAPEQALVQLLQAAQRVGRKWPDDTRLLSHLGDTAADVAARAGDPLTALRLADLALAQHRAAALVEPLNSEHLIALAEDCLQSGRPDLAWSYADRARDLARGDASLSAYLAEAFARSGYLPAAGRQLAAAVTSKAAAMHDKPTEGSERP